MEAGRGPPAKAWLHRAAARSRHALDQPRRRWLLALVYSLAATIGDRRWCRIRRQGGTWSYRYNGQIILSDQLLLPSATFDQDLEIFLWDYRPEPGDTILDIGAGSGTEAVRFARFVGPLGMVVAVEAHPRTAAVLRQACELNHLTNVVVRAVAVGDQVGTVLLSDEDEPGMNTLFEGGSLEVPMTTLDALVHQLGIKRVALVKMNIEGAERLAIRGAIITASCTDRMVISCHDFLGTAWGATKADVRAWLEGEGFIVLTRPDDPRPWCRDYLYASRLHASGRSQADQLRSKHCGLGSAASL